MIYFDNSATTRVLPQAIAAAEQAMGENFLILPVHTAGRLW